MSLILKLLPLLFAFSKVLSSSYFQGTGNRAELDLDFVQATPYHRVSKRQLPPGNGTRSEYTDDHFRADPYDRRNFRQNNEVELPYTNGSRVKIYKTYGRGKVQIGRGETAHVPNTVSRISTHTTTTVRPGTDTQKEKKKKGKSQNEPCRKKCPEDSTVVAAKGNDFVILPNPCPGNKWNHLSGPRPGSSINEGLHNITGTVGVGKKLCRYQYQVLVHRCGALEPFESDTTVTCSTEDVWGSKCQVVCAPGKEMTGHAELECLDDFKWSHEMPRCKSLNDCTVPVIKSKSKILCQTSNMTTINTMDNSIPDGSTCRFRRNGKPVKIICRGGKWKGTRKVGGRPWRRRQ